MCGCICVGSTPKLTADQVLDYARQGIEHHLPVQAEGYKCTTDDLLNILLTAAARQCTIESACAELSSGPGAETVRQYLNEQLTAERLPDLERQLNEALEAQLPRRLWRGLEVGCDRGRDQGCLPNADRPQ